MPRDAHHDESEPWTIWSQRHCTLSRRDFLDLGYGSVDALVHRLDGLLATELAA